MADYKAMYLRSFRALTDISKLLEQILELIAAVQCECEDIYIESEDEGGMEE